MDPDSQSRLLTNEQRRAIQTRGVSVVLSAGAGCGKTHVLIERYLSHLSEGVEVGQMVAITFTERAAREMRARIREALVARVREVAREDEANQWAVHLRNLETAPICTIHSFCGTLLRQYAVEAELDPNFEVLEEASSAHLRHASAIETLQKQLTAQAGAGEDLRRLVVLCGWRAVKEGVLHLVEKCDEPAWQRWLTTPADVLAAGWEQSAREEVRPRYLAHLFATRPELTGVLPLLRQHPPAAGPLVESARILLEELPRLPGVADLEAAVERLCKAATVGQHGKKAWPDEEVRNRMRDAYSAFREHLRRLNLDQLQIDSATVRSAVEVGQRFLRVALEARRAYQDRKRQLGVVDFQDLLVRARDLLRERPDVTERLRERYRSLLLDELQDTDPVQMDLIQSLCGEAVLSGKLFAVGDASQSIYRFRGADVSLFQELRAKTLAGGDQSLTLNFRSQPGVIHFVNALFGDLLPGWLPLRPHRDSVNSSACVEFLWTANDGMKAAEARGAEAEAIARRLAAMIGREALVAEATAEGPRLRAVRRGDIVLLFRAMTEVPIYEVGLRNHGLDYYLVGGRAFFAQQEIYDVLHLLRSLENPQDEVSLVGALRSPFCCVSDETLYSLRFANGERVSRNLWTGLRDERALERLPSEQRARARRAKQFLDRGRELKDRLPIARLLNELIAESGYDAAVRLEFLGDRKLANLWKLVEMARGFDRSGLFNLADYISRLGDLVDSQPREEQAATQPENADVIRLMSIHQAKGLEFPIVVLPDLDSEFGRAQTPVALWDARLGCVVRPPSDEDPPAFTKQGVALHAVGEEIEDWDESLRILYVACTRAEDYLILSSSLPSALTVSSPWMQTLAARFNLLSGASLSPIESGPTVAVYQPKVEETLHSDLRTSPREIPVELTGRPGPLSPLRSGQGLFDMSDSYDTEDGSGERTWPRGPAKGGS